jgi:uncharacterized protein YidB (DUF937 family)
MIDLGQIVSSLGEQTIVEMGEPLGLNKDQSIRAARALAENFTGDKDQAIEAAAKETGIGKEVLSAMIVKLLDTAKDQAVDHMKDQATQAAKGMFGKFFGR